MRARDDMLIVTDDMGTSGTKTYNLDYADIISGLDLYITATNGGNHNKDAPIERCITTIEIVDGSDVLWSLPGDVAYALFSQLQGHPANEYASGAAGDAPYVSIPVRFGRELYDPVLALNPNAFRNPQLKVTFNEATVRAASDDGYSTDSFNLSVVTHLMEDVGPPEGFLSAKDLYDFTSAASGDERIDMPTDYPYRQLMVRAYEDGTDMRSTLIDYELNCDGGKFKPFDASVTYLVNRMMEMYPCTYKMGYETATDGENIQTWMGIDSAQTIHAHSSGFIVGATSFWPGRFTVRLKTHDNSAGGDRPIHWLVKGWGVHNTLFIPFGRLNEIAEWFNAPQYGNIRLILGQDNINAEVNVCVQQYRRY